MKKTISIIFSLCLCLGLFLFSGYTEAKAEMLNNKTDSAETVVGKEEITSPQKILKTELKEENLTSEKSEKNLKEKVAVKEKSETKEKKKEGKKHGKSHDEKQTESSDS